MNNKNVSGGNVLHWGRRRSVKNSAISDRHRMAAYADMGLELVSFSCANGKLSHEDIRNLSMVIYSKSVFRVYGTAYRLRRVFQFSNNTGVVVIETSTCIGD